MSKNKPKAKVVIVIPVLNNLGYTKGVLKTLEMKVPFATLIIDNGSTDGTFEYCTKELKKENFFYLKLKENIGCGGAWNLGIRFGLADVGADYIFLLNNDILLLPQTLNTMLGALKTPGMDLVSARDISGQVASEEEFFKTELPKNSTIAETPDFSCFALSRSTVDKVGLFDEVFYPAYFEDNDYHYRIKLAKLKAYCLYGAYYFHYGSRTRVMNANFKEYLDARYIKNRDLYIAKWGGEPGKERFKTPFNGNPPKTINIDDCGYKPEEIIKKMIKK